jgi:hypothetical protein
MDKNQRQLLVPVSLKKRVVDYAWENRVSASSIIRGIIEEYANGSLTYTPSEIHEELIAIRSQIAEDVWREAQRRAVLDGVSLSEVVRKALESKLE